MKTLMRLLLLLVVLAFSVSTAAQEPEMSACDLLNGGLGSVDVDRDGIQNCKDNCVLDANPIRKIPTVMVRETPVSGANVSGKSGKSLFGARRADDIIDFHWIESTRSYDKDYVNPNGWKVAFGACSPDMSPGSTFTWHAQLRIPSCDLDDPLIRARSDTIDQYSFSPWHTIEEHRPLGSVMRARRVAYQASANLRGHSPEPTSLPI